MYKDIRDNHLGEELACRHERNNIHDFFAVGVIKSDVIVCHMPRGISAACYVFLGQAGSTISCKVTDLENIRKIFCKVDLKYLVALNLKERSP